MSRDRRLRAAATKADLWRKTRWSYMLEEHEKDIRNLEEENRVLRAIIEDLQHELFDSTNPPKFQPILLDEMIPKPTALCTSVDWYSLAFSLDDEDLEVGRGNHNVLQDDALCTLRLDALSMRKFSFCRPRITQPIEYARFDHIEDEISQSSEDSYNYRCHGCGSCEDWADKDFVFNLCLGCYENYCPRCEPEGKVAQRGWTCASCVKAGRDPPSECENETDSSSCLAFESEESMYSS